MSSITIEHSGSESTTSGFTPSDNNKSAEITGLNDNFYFDTGLSQSTVYYYKTKLYYTEGDPSISNQQSTKAGTYLLSFSYDSRGNRIRIAEKSYASANLRTTDFSYDSLNRVTRIDFPEAGSLSYAYDNNSNITQVTYPDSTAPTYAYDAANHLTRFTDTDSGNTSYAYDNAGNLTRKDNANSTYTTYAYNNRNRLTNIEHKKSDNSTIASFTYLYDYAGNRTKVTEADSSYVNYAYDSNYRLTGEVRSGTNDYDISYAYDDVGNRTRMVKDGATSTYSYNSLNQLNSKTTSGATTNYAYSTNGNLIRETAGSDSTLFSYTFDNKMAKVDLPDNTAIYYLYDGQGNRRLRASQAGSNWSFIYHYTDPISSIPNIIADADASFSFYRIFWMV